MTLFTIISTVVFYLWLGVIAWLLWRGQTYTQKIQHALLDLVGRAQETAHAASEATRALMILIKERESSHDQPS